MNTRSGSVSLRAFLVAAAWVAAAGLASNALRLTANGQPTSPQQPLNSKGDLVAARTPYTVVLRDGTETSAGAQALYGEQTLALRSDGAYVERWQYEAGQHATIQRFVYLPSGVTIVVDDVRELATSTLQRTGTHSSARVDPDRNCVANSLGEPLSEAEVLSTDETIQGYRTVKVTIGQSTFWFAPQIGCAKLKARTRLPSGLVSEKQLISITSGPPDASLFFVPARYKEVQYSKFYAIDPESPEGQRLDRVYFARRPPR
jgi:hypothetical protein